MEQRSKPVVQGGSHVMNTTSQIPQSQLFGIACWMPFTATLHKTWYGLEEDIFLPSDTMEFSDVPVLVQ